MPEFKSKEEYERWKAERILDIQSGKYKPQKQKRNVIPNDFLIKTGNFLKTPLKTIASEHKVATTILLLFFIFIGVRGFHTPSQNVNIDLSAQIYKLNYDYAYKSGLEGGKDDKVKGFKDEPEIAFAQPAFQAMFQAINKILSDMVVDKYGEAYRHDAEKGLRDGLIAGYRDGFKTTEHRYAKEKSLGITYDQTMAYLSDHFVMQKGASIEGKDNYVGRSALGLLQLIGDKSDLSEASITIGIPKDTKVFNEYNSLLTFRFLKNIFPDWTNMDSEITDSMKSLLVSPDKAVTIFRGNKQIEVELFKETGMLCLTVKPL